MAIDVVKVQAGPSRDYSKPTAIRAFLVAFFATNWNISSS
jgi:hypothetical protein